MNEPTEPEVAEDIAVAAAGCVVLTRTALGLSGITLFGRVTAQDLERMAAVMLVKSAEMAK